MNSVETQIFWMAKHLPSPQLAIKDAYCSSEQIVPAKVVILVWGWGGGWGGGGLQKSSSFINSLSYWPTFVCLFACLFSLRVHFFLWRV